MKKLPIKILVVLTKIAVLRRRKRSLPTELLVTLYRAFVSQAKQDKRALSLKSPVKFSFVNRYVILINYSMRNGNHDTRMKNCHWRIEITLGEKKRLNIMMTQRYTKKCTLHDENENCGVKMDTHNSSLSFSEPLRTS